MLPVKLYRTLCLFFAVLFLSACGGGGGGGDDNSYTSPYAGTTWSGTVGSPQSGTWTFTVAANATLTGTVVTPSGTYNLVGGIHDNGTLISTRAESSKGSADIFGSVSGNTLTATWYGNWGINTLDPRSGSFNGSRSVSGGGGGGGGGDTGFGHPIDSGDGVLTFASPVTVIYGAPADGIPHVQATEVYFDSTKVADYYFSTGGSELNVTDAVVEPAANGFNIYMYPNVSDNALYRRMEVIAYWRPSQLQVVFYTNTDQLQTAVCYTAPSTYSPKCSTLGLTLDRAAGKLSFPITGLALAGMTSSTNTVSGTLYFPPF